MPVIIQTGLTTVEIEAQIEQAQLSGEEFIFNKLSPQELKHALEIIFSKKLTKFTWAFIEEITVQHVKAINKYLKRLPLPNNILLNIKLNPTNQSNTNLFEKFDARWHSLITFYAVDIESETIKTNCKTVEIERQVGQKYKISQENAEVNKNNKKLKIVAEPDDKFIFAAAREEYFSKENGMRCAYYESLSFLNDLDTLRQNSKKTQLEIPFILKTDSIEKVLTKITSIRLFEDIKIHISRAESNFKELQRFLAKYNNTKLNLTIHVTQLSNKNYCGKEINFKIQHHRIRLEGEIENIVLISTVHTSPVFNNQRQIQGYNILRSSADIFKIGDNSKWRYKKFTPDTAGEYSLNDTFTFHEPKPRDEYFKGEVINYNYLQSKFFQKDLIKLKNNLNISNVYIPYFFHSIVLHDVLSKIISIRSFEKIKIHIQPTKVSFSQLQMVLQNAESKLNLTIYVAKSFQESYSENNLTLKTFGHYITLEGETKNIELESVTTRLKSPNAALAITSQTDLPQHQYMPTFFPLVKMDEEMLTKSENTSESSTNKWLDDVTNLYNSKFLGHK